VIYRNLRSDVSGRGLLGLPQYVFVLGLIQYVFVLGLIQYVFVLGLTQYVFVLGLIFDGDGQVAEDLGVIGEGDVEIGTIFRG
jgi:hypothetical protein